MGLDAFTVAKVQPGLQVRYNRLLVPCRALEFSSV